MIFDSSVLLYCTVLHCTVLYCNILYCTVLYCTVLYCTILHYTVLFYPVLHSLSLSHTHLSCFFPLCLLLSQPFEGFNLSNTNKKEMETKSSSDFGTGNITYQNTAKAVTVTVQACKLSKLCTVISVMQLLLTYHSVCNDPYCLYRRCTSYIAIDSTI